MRVWRDEALVKRLLERPSLRGLDLTVLQQSGHFNHIGVGWKRHDGL